MRSTCRPGPPPGSTGSVGEAFRNRARRNCEIRNPAEPGRKGSAYALHPARSSPCGAIRSCEPLLIEEERVGSIPLNLVGPGGRGNGVFEGDTPMVRLADVVQILIVPHRPR